MTAAAFLPPCHVTGKPCRWLSEEWYGEDGEMGRTRSVWRAAASSLRCARMLPSRSWLALALVASACGGAASSELALDPDPAVTAPAARAAAADASDSAADAVTDDAAMADAPLSVADAGGDASDSSAPTDAAPEATADAAADASADAADAADASEPPPPPPPPPPPFCVSGATRCTDYRFEVCQGGVAWEWQVGVQSCCHDARFTVVGSTVVDSVGGHAWYRYGGLGAPSCSAVLPNGRLPTSAELLAITIGPPVANKSVCSPTIDQVAFQNVAAGDTTTSDGCVDLIRGTSKGACGAGVAGFLCVSP